MWPRKLSALNPPLLPFPVLSFPVLTFSVLSGHHLTQALYHSKWHHTLHSQSARSYTVRVQALCAHTRAHSRFLFGGLWQKANLRFRAGVKVRVKIRVRDRVSITNRLREGFN